jgi:cytoskeletal protein CcmA (bactofilin family)
MLGRRRFDDSVTLISTGTELVGDLRFGHQLYLNGRVEGDVTASEDSQATVVISETGSVRGDIRVPNVIISGRVEGDVYAAGRIELAASAQVRGNVHYRLMEMQSGALVEGQLLHHEGASERADAPAGEGGQPALKSVASVGRAPGG